VATKVGRMKEKIGRKRGKCRRQGMFQSGREGPGPGGEVGHKEGSWGIAEKGVPDQDQEHIKRKRTATPNTRTQTV